MSKLLVTCRLPTYDKPSDPNVSFDEIGPDEVIIETHPDMSRMIVIKVGLATRMVRITDLKRALENCEN